MWIRINRLISFQYDKLWIVAGFWMMFIGLSAPLACAVEEGRTSYTAQAVCAFRAICALDPDPKTRNPDDMAKHFISPRHEDQFPGLGLPYEDAKIAADGMNTGVLYWINARTHHIDAELKAALESGFKQVVILGAGFDSRAYRFHKNHPEVRFFEVDLPATSEDKQNRIRKIIGKSPEWVTYVAIDFNTQTLDDVLVKAGFALNQKTFFIWEGVTYYISGVGVMNTLQFVAECSSPGSRIVFDYMLQDVVQGLDYSPHGAKYTVFVIANMGEPYIFGIDPGDLKSFVNRSGLTLLSDLGPDELTRRYLIHSDGAISGKMAAFMRIVVAHVPPAEQREQLRQRAKSHGAVKVVRNKLREGHLVAVPDDVQKLFTAHANSIKQKDFSAVFGQHSKKYLEFGLDREQVIPMISQLYQRQPIDRYDIVLTRFEQHGNQAKIDGFVQRKGFRTPLMVNDIIRERDGQWRWYGNQKR